MSPPGFRPPIRSRLLGGSGPTLKIQALVLAALLASSAVRASKFTVGGDGVTVKYSFKMKGLDEPPFVAGTGTALIKVGPRCFTDPSDTCTLSGSGRAARCK
jgi:hypothetical protein